MQALLNAIAAMARPLDAQRIFHGRGGLYPGCEHWSLDAYPPVLLLTSFLPVSVSELATLQAALDQRWRVIAPGEPFNLAFQSRADGQLQTRMLHGEVPEPHVVSEGEARFRVHVLKGQNHGLILDMAQGRRWVRQHVQDNPPSKVLNLFAYTCAFSVVALQAGAMQVVNVDMGSAAMAVGQQNHQLSGVGSKATFWVHDIFKTWGKISRSGPYGLVIVDPPSYQKGSFVATKDYARLVRRLPDLLAPDGRVLLCLNAPELGEDFLHTLVQQHAPELEFVQRLANSAVFADVDAQRSLKVLVYKASDQSC